MYTIHHGQSPVYLSEQVNTVAAQTLHSRLRSASTTNYVIPQLLTKLVNELFHMLDRQHGTHYHTA